MQGGWKRKGAADGRRLEMKGAGIERGAKNLNLCNVCGKPHNIDVWKSRDTGLLKILQNSRLKT